MMKSFCGAISGSPEHEWTVEAGIGTEEEAAAKVMSKTINNNGDQDPNNPTGVALSACISFWLAVPMRRVFEFLRSETSRHEVFRDREIISSSIPKLIYQQLVILIIPYCGCCFMHVFAHVNINI